MQAQARQGRAGRSRQGRAGLRGSTQWQVDKGQGDKPIAHADEHHIEDDEAQNGRIKPFMCHHLKAQPTHHTISQLPLAGTISKLPCQVHCPTTGGEREGGQGNGANRGIEETIGREGGVGGGGGVGGMLLGGRADDTMHGAGLGLGGRVKRHGGTATPHLVQHEQLYISVRRV